MRQERGGIGFHRTTWDIRFPVIGRTVWLKYLSRHGKEPFQHS